MKKIIKTWLIPLLISIGLFTFVRTTFAQFVEETPSLDQYLLTGSIPVGSDKGENGYQQIYYTYNNNKNYVTNTGYANGEPDTDHEYITWMGEVGGSGWQIFLYHIPSSTTIQLSSSLNNANPKIGDGKVVWEGWTDTGWQIFLFDGKSVEQLTSGDPSINPDIDGDFVIYARKDISGTYRTVIYSISKRQAKEVTTGLSSKHPEVKNGKIILAEGTEEFPLTVEDMFVLDLSPLTATESAQTVSEEDIIKELSASPSATVEVPQETPTPTNIPLE